MHFAFVYVWFTLMYSVHLGMMKGSKFKFGRIVGDPKGSTLQAVSIAPPMRKQHYCYEFKSFVFIFEALFLNLKFFILNIRFCSVFRRVFVPFVLNFNTNVSPCKILFQVLMFCSVFCSNVDPDPSDLHSFGSLDPDPV